MTTTSSTVEVAAALVPVVKEAERDLDRVVLDEDSDGAYEEPRPDEGAALAPRLPVRRR